MGVPVLICPFDRTLLDRLSGRRLCVRVDAPSDIAEAARAVGGRNELVRILYDAAVPLSEIVPDEAWRGIPLSLSVPAMGRFRDLAAKLRLLRSLGIWVGLPDGDRNMTDARVLASLGIPTRIVLDVEGSRDWEALADFATYALLGLAPHAPIEPFRTIQAAYRLDTRARDWGEAWFDDPSRYLHLDAGGNIALTHAALLRGDFVASDPAALDGPDLEEAIDNSMEAWRDFFLEDHFCAKCPGWKLCRGRFSKGKTAPDGCADFFCELETLVAQSLKRRKSNGSRAP